MSSYTEKLNKKVGLLRDRLLAGKSFAELEKEFVSKHCGPFAAFVTVCNIQERAHVFRAAGDTPEKAWLSAADNAEHFVDTHDFDAVWVKGEITCRSESVLFTEVTGKIATGYHEFFRRGISFDEGMETALTEGEINGSRVISYKKQTIELQKVNKHLASNGINTLSELPVRVILFDCISCFCDEKNEVFDLYSEGNDCGRRIVDRVDRDVALRVISTSSEYLSMQVGLDGKFDYGYYPIFHKEIPGYNMLRHASSIWSLICSYRLTGDRFTLRQIENAIGYMLKNVFRKYRNTVGDNTSFLADKYHDEVKIGGNSIAIIMLTEYMDAVGSDEYVGVCRELGNGILELFDARDGSFFHVLHYPSLSPKDKFRTVYYDGETVFALCRLYGITKDRKWLNTAKKASERFIKENYTKHRDHWVAYAMNELTKYVREERFLEFALRNAQVNLEKIYRQPTTYHTYLELLCVTFELYLRIKEQKLKCGYLQEFDLKRFVETIYRRAWYMLNGYGYPEYVMYFKYPETALGAFFVRHDGYRIRIDDIQHYCGAYYSFYRNYDELERIRLRFEGESAGAGADAGADTTADITAGTDGGETAEADS